MKQVLFAEGGRPFYDDDLETIQSEANAAATALLMGLGTDCVVTGCRVSATGTSYAITPGLVWMGGQLLRFLGAVGVSLPATLLTGDVQVLDERTYQTGDTKTCIQEQNAVVVANATVGLSIYAAGILSLRQAVQALNWEVGDVKWGAIELKNYDATGLGTKGGPAWGWGLCNGQGGRMDLRGRFVATYDPDETDYAAVGNSGGANQVTLGVDNLPPHAHDANFRISDGGADYPFVAARNSSANANGSQITTKKTGGGQPFDARPPYYVLAARQWVGF